MTHENEMETMKYAERSAIRIIKRKTKSVLFQEAADVKR